MWPYGAASIFTGVIAIRSLFFGSCIGLLGGKLAKNIYDKFYINN